MSNRASYPSGFPHHTHTSGFPSTSYASPRMSTAYSSPSSGGQHDDSSGRTQMVGTAGPGRLPSMRAFDTSLQHDRPTYQPHYYQSHNPQASYSTPPQQPQQPQQHQYHHHHHHQQTHHHQQHPHHQHPHTPSVAPASQLPPPYYGQPPMHMTSNAYGVHVEGMDQRYNVPFNDPRASMTGGRPKKVRGLNEVDPVGMGRPDGMGPLIPSQEIKRRTKTGCFTCRKRRIKCDEQHPVCKNCQKSKRDCMGYDPLFKQQQQQLTSPTGVQPTLVSETSNVSAAGTYGSGPSSIASPGSVGSMLPPHSYGQMSGVASSSDPKPETADSSFDSVDATSSSLASRLHLRGGGSSPLFPTPSRLGFSAPTQSPINESSRARMKVEELISLIGPRCPHVEKPLPEDMIRHIRKAYTEIYAPGLEAFFESKWFSMEQSINAALENTATADALASFLARNGQDSYPEVEVLNEECWIVWDLARLVNAPGPKADTPPSMLYGDGLQEVQARVAIVENLLSGTFLQENPVKQPSSQYAKEGTHRARSLTFWYNLGAFVCLNGKTDVRIQSQVEHVLSNMRNVLDGRENRDILYSVAIIRAYAFMVPPEFESSLPDHLDESNPKNKLVVARKFIRHEAQFTAGTMNVARRFSDIAVRAFITPGVNL